MATTINNTRPISELRTDPLNPRKQSKAAADGLSLSIEMFGDINIITFNDVTGEIVGGHKRIESLRRAGAKSYVREEGSMSGYIEHPRTKERFAVRFVNWDKSKQRIANLTANNPHIHGEFTEDAIDQLREIEDATARQALELDALIKEMSGDEVKERERRTLENFDVTPPAVRTWVLVATDEITASEIESLLREKYEGPNTRIEVSGVR